MKPCHWTMMLLLLAWVATADVSWTNCPPACRCRWVSGRKVAECVNASLATVPANLSSEIQVLDLSHNAFPSLPADTFRAVALVNLHKVFLRRCGIAHVDQRAFSGLGILIELDLSWNHIRALHPLTFRDNERLRILHVSHNLLQRMEDGLFSGLAFLQAVDASDCRLVHLGRRTFIDVPKLHELRLSRNNLSTVKLASFEHIHSLLSLEVSGNPWRCDCHLKPFLDWTLRRNLYTPPTACEAPPRLQGRLWSELGAGDLACRPQVRVPSPHVEAAGPNVTLACLVSGSPAPEVRWMFNSRALTNTSRGSPKYWTAGDARWLNLTVVGVGAYDVGNYTCVATSAGGSAARNVTLRVGGVVVGVEGSTMRAAGRLARAWALLLGLAAGAAIFTAGVAALVFRLCGRGGGHAGKPAGAGEEPSCEEKLLLAAVNPVQKPPRRLDSSLVTSVAVERDQVTFNLLESGAAYRARGSGAARPPDLLPPAPLEDRAPLLGAARKPRVASWCEGSTYDNLGPRTTADGSSTLSLDEREAAPDTTVRPAASRGEAPAAPGRHRSSWCADHGRVAYLARRHSAILSTR